MAAIALMPMALYLAALFSADNAAIALSFLFVAFFLRLAFGEPQSVLTRRQLVILTVLIVALAGGKTLLYPVLLLLLPPSRFRSPRHRWLWLGTWAALAAGTLLSWQWINRSNAERLVAVHGEHGILMSANFHFIATHPFSFLEMAVRTLWVMKSEYLSEFVGKLGWLSIPLPTWLIWTYVGTLILIAISSAKFELGSRLRCLFLLLAAASVLSGFVWVWTLDTPTAQMGSLRMIAGFQGRYFIPAAFPLASRYIGKLAQDGPPLGHARSAVFHRPSELCRATRARKGLLFRSLIERLRRLGLSAAFG